MLIVSIFKLDDYSLQLKKLGAQALELRLDLMSQSDLLQLVDFKDKCNLPLILTLKPSSLKIELFEDICKNLQPHYIDLDYSIFNLYEKKLKRLIPSSQIIVSKHTPNMYELEKFFKGYPQADFKKLVIETNDTALGLKIALKAQKEQKILFASGFDTSFTRFFSLWHYCYVSTPTGVGQLDIHTLTRLYTKTHQLRQFFALIGNPLHQSLSHITHNALLKGANKELIYLKIPLKQKDLLISLYRLKALGCRALSITTPFKKVIPQSFYPTQLPMEVINTLDLKKKRALNTDNLALLEGLKGYIKPTILILGNGAVASGFKKLFIGKTPFSSWSRSHPLPLSSSYDIIINATSSENPLTPLPSCHLLVNLFHGCNSPLIEKIAAKQGASVISGQSFFYMQAMEQFKFWFDDFQKITQEEFFSLVKEPKSAIQLL